MFGTKDVKTTPSLGKYIGPGNQYIAIRSWDIKTASSGSKQVIMHVETPPLDAPGFTPETGFQGQIGKVALPGTYVVLSNEKAVNEFNRTIGCIADELGVRTELDKISGKDFEEYVNQVMTLFKDKFAWWAISGEEYMKVNGGVPGKTGIKLAVRRWHWSAPFIASTEKGAAALGEWDKTKSWNYKSAVRPDQTQQPLAESEVAAKDDLPF